tara:strand:- start:18698 stop:18910 length:213 start_codon:yes stop_codon:yes gene_type:complete
MIGQDQPQPTVPTHRKLLLSKSEAAALLGLHQQTFQRYVQAGELPKPFFKSSNGRANKWSRLQLEAYLTQ